MDLLATETSPSEPTAELNGEAAAAIMLARSASMGEISVYDRNHRAVKVAHASRAVPGFRSWQVREGSRRPANRACPGGRRYLPHDGLSRHRQPWRPASPHRGHLDEGAGVFRSAARR